MSFGRTFGISGISVERGIDQSTVRIIASIAAQDKETALEMMAMPFLQTLESEEFDTLQYLRELAASSVDALKQVLSHPELQGGITDDNLTRVWLLYLGWRDPEAAAAIEAIPWVNDGIAPPSEHRTVSFHIPEFETLEQRIVVLLIDLAEENREALLALARQPWLQGELVGREVSVVYALGDIADRDKSVVGEILGMPFLDSIEALDLRTLRAMNHLLEIDRHGLRSLLSHPTLHDGITDEERGDVVLLALEVLSPDWASAIRSLPWAGDGIDPSEEEAILSLHQVARESPRMLSQLMLMRRSWVEDGLTPEEISVINYLTALSGQTYVSAQEAAAMQLLVMPFLDEVDRVDVLATGALVSLANDRLDLSMILAHPTLAGGIGDEHAKIVAVFGSLEINRQELIGALLDPHRGTVEERYISLPLAGDVLLTVVRVDPVMPQAMDWLEDAVRSHEEFMGEALPTNYVSLLVADAHERGGSGGPGGILTANPSRDRVVISHEAAHIYWAGFVKWVAEGGAELLADVSQEVIRPPTAGGCSLANNLAELERHELGVFDSDRGPERDRAIDTIWFSGCNYSLGRSLFAELYRDIGSDVFRRGFRSLYFKILNEEHEEECRGLERPVCLVKAAFVESGDVATSQMAEEIINRRYYGS